MENYATFHDLQDRSVFITDGGSGIGASITEAFLQQGSKVAFVQKDNSRAFCDDMQAKYGERPHFTQCNIGEIDELRIAMVQATNTNGPIDILINSTSVETAHDLKGFSVDEWNAVMNINLRPGFFTAQAVAESMKRKGGGSIINLSSLSYLTGETGYPAFVASKAGITGLTRALARELGPDNIRVNAVVPGLVMTAKRQQELEDRPDSLQKHLQQQCLKDALLPEDIVATVLFLASKTSRMITGQALVVDGGVVTTG